MAIATEINHNGCRPDTRWTLEPWYHFVVRLDIIRRAHEHPKGVVKRYLVAIVNTGTMRDTLKPKRKRRVETADLFQVIREDAI